MNNKDNISQFDKLFSEGLRNTSLTPPPGVWEGVASATSGAASASSAGIISKIVGASVKVKAVLIGAVAVTAVTTGLILNSNINSKSSTAESLPQTTTFENSSDLSKKDKLSTEKAVPLITEKESKEGSSEESTNKTLNKESKTDLTSKVLKQSKADENKKIGDANSSNSSRSGDSELPKAVVKKVEAKSNQPTLSAGANLNIRNHTVCPNSDCSMYVEPVQHVAKVVWFVNGSRHGESMGLYSAKFQRSGENRVRAEVEFKDGSKRVLEDVVQVKEIKSDFKFELDKKSEIVYLRSVSVSDDHQWYANDELIRSVQPNTTWSFKGLKQFEITHVAKKEGCSSETVMQIEVPSSCNEEVEIENIFTPHLIDGKNDEFLPGFEGSDGYSFQVFTMDFTLVFETKNPSLGWNGRFNNAAQLMPSGWYTYIITYKCDGELKNKRGKVLLAD